MLMRKLRFSRFSWLFYLIPLVLITVSLILSTYVIRSSIESYLMSEMAKHSEHISVNYMSRLSNSAEASEVINDLIEQKLAVAGKALADLHSSAHDEDLEQLAEDYEIDVIYIFNDAGEVHQSIDNEFVGWQAPPGHPVHDFMISDKDFLVEEIRQDTESGRYYKYAYIRADDGCFLQIGMAADSIRAITEKFTMEYYIEALGNEDDNQNVYFVNHNGTLIADSRGEGNELALSSSELVAVRSQIPMDLRSNYDGRDYYRSLVPVFVSDRYTGTLIIDNDLSEHNSLIRNLYTTTFVIAIVIFLILSWFAISVASRSRKLIRYAYYDDLTGLPNLNYMKEVSQLQTMAQESKGAVLMLDIVNFRKLNMLAGRDTGDMILKQLTQKLADLLPQTDSLFRLSADRFIIWRKTYRDEAELLELCHRLEAIGSMSYSDILGQQSELRTEADDSVAVKIGVLKLTGYHHSMDAIIKDLEILLDYIKSQPAITYGFFNESMRHSMEEAEQIKASLKNIVSTGSSVNEEFSLVFQPQININEKIINRYEALARLAIKEIGSIAPPRFIELAERNQLIVDLGRLVLVKACEFLVDLERQGYSNQIVAVNVSSIELFHDNFAVNLLEVVNRYGLKPEQIEIEITETTLIANYSMIYDELERLYSQGVKIAIDDFGTGYSSLSRLGTLPITCIKIDKVFIDGLAKSTYSELMVETIINIAHKTNVEVVAEGVETKEQVDALTRFGCDYIQGYYYSRPVSAAEIVTMLEERS